MSIKRLNRHQRITIMGLGLFGGGVGAARFWAELGSEVTVTDLRDADTLTPSIMELSGLGIRFHLGAHHKEDFKNCDLLVVNPAVKPDNRFVRLARDAGARVTTEIGLVFKLASGPIIGITGSNGKSTTTALIGEMLHHNDADTLVGGNIGGSLLQDLPHHLPSSPLVLELSSFQLHYLIRERVSPNISIVTNLSPNHLDWHGTTLSYYEDKRNIVRFQTNDDAVILNAEDPTLREWSSFCKGRKVMVARNDPGDRNACFLDNDENIVVRLDNEKHIVAPISLLKIPGEHNRLNALLAAAAVYTYCRDADAIRKGIEIFNGLPHRLELVADIGGKTFINDSIATTPESAICALHSFDVPKVIIAGGYDKGTPFDELGKEISKHAHAAILIGDTAQKIAKAIVASDNRCIIKHCTDFEQAIRQATDLCPDDGVVLLSPACASYGMFKNFQERGELFREIVLQKIQ